MTNIQFIKTTAIKALLLLLLFTGGNNLRAQDDKETPDPEDAPPKKSKFLTGFYVGSYFANKYSS
ncbi:MAG: hypothetical protein IT236_16600, partial [Bacteroidia bacterium]|nr:hypothetical protein [Bacteroidia bacterium]